MLLQLTRVFKTSYFHILRNFKLSLASTLVMALTFFVSSLFLLSLYSANIVLNYFERQSQIIVFFNPDVIQNQNISSVKALVNGEGFPVSVKYVSQQQAYKIFTDFLKQDSPTLSQSVNADKLPPSLEITTTNLDNLDRIATDLYTLQNHVGYIDKILYYKNVEDILKAFIRVVQYAGLGFVGFLGGVSLLIIWITIGIALSSHADEIEIMQLVGATQAFIEFPYIIEGAIYGMLGALLSLGCLGILYIVLSHLYVGSLLVFLSYFKGIPFPTIGLNHLVFSMLIEMLIGALVGSIGSFIAIRKQLK